MILPGNIRVFSDRILQDRESAALTFVIFPLRNGCGQRLPRSAVGSINLKALRGNSKSGFVGIPTVLQIDGSTMSMRSPLSPSTLPYPGASDPANTLNGMPDFKSHTPESVHLPKAWRSHAGMEETPGESQEPCVRKACGLVECCWASKVFEAQGVALLNDNGFRNQFPVNYAERRSTY